jgi:hypothetical protein
MSNVKREIEYNGFDGVWKMEITFDHKIVVTKDDESREYQLPPIVKIEHDTEYVFLELENNNSIQVKFEIDNFLVIDEFDKEGEWVDSIGSHVFGEENKVE